MADPYFSELKYLGGPTLDFVEIAVDIGADVSDLVVTIYNGNGTVRTTNAVDGLTPTTINGKDVYVIDTTTSATFNGLGKTNGISLSDGTGVYDFFSFDDLASPITATAGAASGMTSTQIGQAGAGDSLETTDGGATYYVQTTPNSGSIPCFTAGTEIQTAHGCVKVEDLARGDLVVTDDGTHSPILAVFQRTIGRAELNKSPNLFPIRISAGALADGLPQRDLLVSRQHRMLVTSKIAERMFGVREVLIPANKLTALPGIYVDTSVQSVTYIHLLFAAHEVIFAEGAPTESLFLGDQVLGVLPEETIEEIANIFPELHVMCETAIPTRLVPLGKKQKQLIARHAKNEMALIGA